MGGNEEEDGSSERIEPKKTILSKNKIGIIILISVGIFVGAIVWGDLSILVIWVFIVASIYLISCVKTERNDVLSLSPNNKIGSIILITIGTIFVISSFALIYTMLEHQSGDLLGPLIGLIMGIPLLAGGIWLWQKTTKKICPRCGYKIPITAKVCIFCGADLEEE